VLSLLAAASLRWAERSFLDYFEDLATPSEQQSFDSTFSALVTDDVDILTEIFTKYRQPMQEVTEEELSVFKNRTSNTSFQCVWNFCILKNYVY
jgi:hypothetical protein